jgi:2-polyprenyl-6-methoxyphenol hydroxylase-like FAD-dependent oxidoreductase
MREQSATIMSAHGEFDAIVIGSGMGGFAFASTMAKPRQWHVLVRHRWTPRPARTQEWSRALE